MKVCPRSRAVGQHAAAIPHATFSCQTAPLNLYNKKEYTAFTLVHTLPPTHLLFRQAVFSWSTPGGVRSPKAESITIIREGFYRLDTLPVTNEQCQSNEAKSQHWLQYYIHLYSLTYEAVIRWCNGYWQLETDDWYRLNADIPIFFHVPSLITDIHSLRTIYTVIIAFAACSSVSTFINCGPISHQRLKCWCRLILISDIHTGHSLLTFWHQYKTMKCVLVQYLY